MDATNESLRKSKAQISTDVSSIATYLPGLIRVFVPSVTINRIPEGWEQQEPYKKSNTTGPVKETSVERSLRRSRRTVYDLVVCNPFELFATFTISTDRYDDEKSKAKMFNWLHNQRKKNGRSQYLLVPERHKDGALHFHAVIAGYNGKLKQSFNASGQPILKHKKPVYEFPEYRSGFSSAQRIGNEHLDIAVVARYISKYITKDLDTTPYVRRYWASLNLLRPITEDNPEWWQNVKPDYVSENEFGKQLIYSSLESKTLPEYVKLFTATGEYR